MKRIKNIYEMSIITPILPGMFLTYFYMTGTVTIIDIMSKIKSNILNILKYNFV